MSLQLTPELAATVQGFLASGHYTSDEEVLREALAALQERDVEFGKLLAALDDETAGRIQPWSEARAELRFKYGMAN
jgi:putative addiction module CopG family antidote